MSELKLRPLRKKRKAHKRRRRGAPRSHTPKSDPYIGRPQMAVPTKAKGARYTDGARSSHRKENPRPRRGELQEHRLKPVPLGCPYILGASPLKGVVFDFLGVFLAVVGTAFGLPPWRRRSAPVARVILSEAKDLNEYPFSVLPPVSLSFFFSSLLLFHLPVTLNRTCRAKPISS
jgi:hypothetical protein